MVGSFLAAGNGTFSNNFNRNVQILDDLLFFVSDRNQLIEFDLKELHRSIEENRYYRGQVLGISVVDFAVTSMGQVCSISENGIIENASSGTSTLPSHQNPCLIRMTPRGTAASPQAVTTSWLRVSVPPRAGYSSSV